MPLRNLLVKQTRLLIRLYAEFFVQDTSTLFVLCQGSSALVVLDVEAHQLAVDVFLQGINGQQLLGVGDGFAQLATLLVKGDQIGQGGEEEVAQAFLFQQYPGFKFGRVANIEASQEVAFIEGDGRCQLAGTGSA